MPAALAPGHLLSAAAPPQAALHAPANHQDMVRNSVNQATTNCNINLHPEPAFPTDLKHVCAAHMSGLHGATTEQGDVGASLCKYQAAHHATAMLVYVHMHVPIQTAHIRVHCPYV